MKLGLTTDKRSWTAIVHRDIAGFAECSNKRNVIQQQLPRGEHITTLAEAMRAGQVLPERLCKRCFTAAERAEAGA